MSTFKASMDATSATIATRNALKIPAWGGYVWKTTGACNEQEIAAGKYELRYVKKSGQQFVFKWNGTTDFTYLGAIAAGAGGALQPEGTPDPGTTLVHDPDLLEAYNSDEWGYGAQSAFEASRAGSGEW